MVNATNILKKIPVLGTAYKKNYGVFKHAFHNFLRESGLRTGPLMVSWVATNRCDSKCVYCEARANEADPQELTTAEIKKVLDQLNDLKVRRFFVIGGEPLMRQDLFEVLAYARKFGMEVGIFTNSQRYKKYQQEIQAAGLQHIWTASTAWRRPMISIGAGREPMKQPWRPWAPMPALASRYGW